MELVEEKKTPYVAEKTIESTDPPIKTEDIKKVGEMEKPSVMSRLRGWLSGRSANSKIVTVLGLGAALWNVSPAAADVRYSSSPENLPSGAVVLMDERGDFYSMDQEVYTRDAYQRRDRGIVYMTDKRFGRDISSQGITKVALTAEGGRLRFQTQLDDDIPGPLYVVPSGDAAEAERKGLPRGGLREKAVVALRNAPDAAPAKPELIGAENLDGPLFMIPGRSVDEARLSGRAFTLIHDKDVKGPVILVRGTNLKPGELPIDAMRTALDRGEHEARRRLDESIRTRRQFEDTAWGHVPRPHMNDWGRTAWYEMERRAREARYRRDEAERRRQAEQYQHRREALDDVRRIREVRDECIQGPLFLVEGRNLMVSDRSDRVVIPTRNLGAPYFMLVGENEGEVEVINEFIGRRMPERQRDMLWGKFMAGVDFKDAELSDNSTNVVDNRSIVGPFFVVEGKDIQEAGVATRDVVAVSRGRIEGPFFMFRPQTIGKGLDQALYERFYSEYRDPITPQDVQQRIYTMADLNRDGLVTGGEISRLMSIYPPESVDRVMRAIAGERAEPAGEIKDVKTELKGKGFILVDVKTDRVVSFTEKDVGYYDGYAQAYVAQQEAAGKGFDTSIVGSVLLNPPAAR